MFIVSRVSVRHKIPIFCLTLLLGLVACTQRRIPSTDEEKVMWLKENALQVRSIAPSDEDFSDLHPLERIIGNARVVMLGEQSHGDGSAFLAKTRLIKFLHQEMGFDVLAFESGLYDCAEAWELLRIGEEAAFAIQQGVLPIWTQSEQVQPLINYMGEMASGEYPLELAGFDNQLTGNASAEHLIGDLKGFLAAHSISISDTAWGSFAASLGTLTRHSHAVGREPIPSASEQDEFLNTSGVLGAKIVSVTEPSDSEAAFWLQMLESIETNAEQRWQMGLDNKGHTSRDPSVLEMRDLQMGHNLVWLAHERYPNRKIIVWAATFHIARNLDQIETARPELQDVYDEISVMGDVVCEALGDQVYSLGFTAYSGTAGGVWQSPEDLEMPSRGSFEDLMKRADLEYAIVDFRHPPRGGEWLRDSMVSRPLGYAEMTARWPVVMDGMMFTRDMMASTRANE